MSARRRLQGRRPSPAVRPGIPWDARPLQDQLRGFSCIS
ncbi:hypothetical protein FM106_13515 [Brachybacterium faecium]|nr:hypothetical protein FM106_13515 [Brachybacterium faecium]